MRIFRRVLLVALCAGIGGLFYWNHYFSDRIDSRTRDASGVQRVALVSRTQTLDRIYESMQGPFSNHAEIRLVDARPRELLWIRGIRCELVERDGRTPISREYFCHSNLTFTPGKTAPDRDQRFTSNQDGRLFTLIPGRMDIALPEGFGLPVWSDEPLDYFSMSLNLNERDQTRRIRFRTAIDFQKQSALKCDMKPLFRRAIYGYEPIGVPSPHSICHSTVHPGMACGPFVGKSASNSFVASLGKTTTIHWMIPPGIYESRVPVSVQLELPGDSTVHYVTAHLHPYGKSVVLFDKTKGQTIFEIRSRGFADRRGVAEMEQRSLPKGVRLYKDHEYELITRYVNPTNAPIDAMSIMYLYMLDEKFQQTESKPAVASR